MLESPMIGDINQLEYNNKEELLINGNPIAVVTLIKVGDMYVSTHSVPHEYQENFHLLPPEEIEKAKEMQVWGFPSGKVERQDVYKAFESNPNYFLNTFLYAFLRELREELFDNSIELNANEFKSFEKLGILFSQRKNYVFCHIEISQEYWNELVPQISLQKNELFAVELKSLDDILKLFASCNRERGIEKVEALNRFLEQKHQWDVILRDNSEGL